MYTVNKKIEMKSRRNRTTTRLDVCVCDVNRVRFILYQSVNWWIFLRLFSQIFPPVCKHHTKCRARDQFVALLCVVYKFWRSPYYNVSVCARRSRTDAHTHHVLRTTAMNERQLYAHFNRYACVRRHCNSNRVCFDFTSCSISSGNRIGLRVCWKEKPKLNLIIIGQEDTETGEEEKEEEEGDWNLNER